MKKILSLVFLFSVLSFAASAQARTLKSSGGYNADTVTNTTAKSLIAGIASGYSKVVLVQFTATKISGTVGGTAVLQGSLDGTNWYNITSAYTMTDVATQTTSFKVVDAGEIYYRVLVTPTGTMSAAIAGKILARNPVMTTRSPSP